ncbi:MAG: ribonuclease H family protein [Bacteroidetes bacterium]|nr:ribonuclease H family protein [Bacteroidota bacterium]MDA3944878.1 ribonuclease H family protein [Bacteroidota bacterium]
MGKKSKYYVVWRGSAPGIYTNWEDCQRQVKGFDGARFKSFKTLDEAKTALELGPEKLEQSTAIERNRNKSNPPNGQSIAVDAACSGNPGKMEYRGVFTESNTELFRSKVFEEGTNNIGEFLALVHGLAWQHKKRIQFPIYSDSQNAINWVKAGKARTKLFRTARNAELFELIARAENWLKNNDFRVPILKWDTKSWGEIPADFGRK